jgi:hypothetical protein
MPFRREAPARRHYLMPFRREAPARRHYSGRSA